MFKVEINIDNDSFSDNQASELARILRDLANRVELDGIQGSYPLFDINGNRIGHAKESQ